MEYHHPLFTAASPAAQLRHHEINGVGGRFFAGAYWRNGFHEDGVVSALAACAPLTGITSLAGAA
jgi:predicted NAD/FAD-binding protein